MAIIACVNCGASRAKHHREGWCFWLSDEEHLPLQYSEGERTVFVLELVDDAGEPLIAPSGVDEPDDEIEALIERANDFEQPGCPYCLGIFACYCTRGPDD